TAAGLRAPCASGPPGQACPSAPMTSAKAELGGPFGLGPATNLPSGTRGVIVAAVDPGSPAARAGITSGDVITAGGGHPTPTTAALSRQTGAHRPGQEVSIEIGRAHV